MASAVRAPCPPTMNPTSCSMGALRPMKQTTNSTMKDSSVIFGTATVMSATKRRSFSQEKEIRQASPCPQSQAREEDKGDDQAPSPRSAASDVSNEKVALHNRYETKQSTTAVRSLGGSQVASDRIESKMIVGPKLTSQTSCIKEIQGHEKSAFPFLSTETTQKSLLCCPSSPTTSSAVLSSEPDNSACISGGFSASTKPKCTNFGLTSSSRKDKNVGSCGKPVQPSTLKRGSTESTSHQGQGRNCTKNSSPTPAAAAPESNCVTLGGAADPTAKTSREKKKEGSDVGGGIVLSPSAAPFKIVDTCVAVKKAVCAVTTTEENSVITDGLKKEILNPKSGFEKQVSTDSTNQIFIDSSTAALIKFSEVKPVAHAVSSHSSAKKQLQSNKRQSKSSNQTATKKSSLGEEKQLKKQKELEQFRQNQQQCAFPRVGGMGSSLFPPTDHFKLHAKQPETSQVVLGGAGAEAALVHQPHRQQRQVSVPETQPSAILESHPMEQRQPHRRQYTHANQNIIPKQHTSYHHPHPQQKRKQPQPQQSQMAPIPAPKQVPIAVQPPSQKQEQYHQYQGHSRPEQSTAIPAGALASPSPVVQRIGTNNALDVVSTAPVPLFERLESEEVAEHKAFARVMEAQTRRLAELERTHYDLERRLELENRRRIDLEERLESQHAEWLRHYRELEEDRDALQKLVSTERLKNEKLLDQVNRKNMEIHRFIQRKYDSNPHHGSERHAYGGTKNSPISSTSSHHHSQHQPRGGANMKFKSPAFFLGKVGTGEAVREKNVTNTLKDFFGM